MSLQGSQRRDQRRRLLVSWTRSGSADPPTTKPSTRSAAEYAPEADPDRHPGIATLLPTRIAGFTMAATGILVVLGAAIALGSYGPAITALENLAGPRFARSVAALRACLDIRGAGSLVAWLGQLLLLGSAVVATAVRLMRRHRRDDSRGKALAWGWLAILLTIAACGTALPLGRLVGGCIADVTGIVLGQDGFGWWVAIAAVSLAAVSLWAVLPLHERLATSLWLAAGFIAWAMSAGCTWIADGRDVIATAGQAAWAAGCGLVAISMLAAARSVIREVRGECGRTSTAKKRTEPARQPAKQPPAEDRTALSLGQQAHTDDDAPASESDSGYTDGSESDEDHGSRQLTKAERKRLKKLARLAQAA
jgi:hypothetical protein